MARMNRVAGWVLALLVAAILVAMPAVAFCPICVGGIGLAVVLSEWFGVDAAIVGVLVGALGVAIGLLVAKWVRDKWGTKFKGQFWVVVIVLYLLTVLPVFFLDSRLFMTPAAADDAGTCPVPEATACTPFQKVLIGTTAGTLVALLSYGLHMWLRKRNNDKVYFPFQGVIIAIVLVALTAAIVYLAVG